MVFSVEYRRKESFRHVLIHEVPVTLLFKRMEGPPIRKGKSLTSVQVVLSCLQRRIFNMREGHLN